jgi:hypothetical protein
MTEPNETKPPTLDYGRAESTPSAWYRRFWTAVQERIDGIFKFLGLVIYFLGGLRQVGLALALAYLADGLGLCLQRDPTLFEGPHYMWVGGFLLGLVLPLPSKRNSK